MEIGPEKIPGIPEETEFRQARPALRGELFPEFQPGMPARQEIEYMTPAQRASMPEHLQQFINVEPEGVSERALGKLRAPAGELPEDELSRSDITRILKSAYEGKEVPYDLQGRLERRPERITEDTGDMRITESQSRILKQSGYKIKPGEKWKAAHITKLLGKKRLADVSKAELRKLNLSEKKFRIVVYDSMFDVVWPFGMGENNKNDTPERWKQAVSTLKLYGFTEKDFPDVWKRAELSKDPAAKLDADALIKKYSGK